MSPSIFLFNLIFLTISRPVADMVGGGGGRVYTLEENHTFESPKILKTITYKTAQTFFMVHMHSVKH